MDWSRAANPKRLRSRQRAPLRSGIRSQKLSTSYPFGNHLAASSIFGIYSGPIAGLAHDPYPPTHERRRRVLLDSAVPAALRDRPATGARVAPGGAGGARRYTSGVAAVVARPARRGEAGDDGESGDRALSRAQAVRARPGALRRAVLPPASGAGPGESGDRAGGAGKGVRGDGRIGRAVRCAREDRRSDQVRSAECGVRNSGGESACTLRTPHSAFRTPGWVGEGKVRLLGRGHARAAGVSRRRSLRGGGEISRRPAARRAAARFRHASSLASARHPDAGRARRAARRSGGIAVRPRRPAAVAPRGGADCRAGGGAGGAGADRRRARVLFGRRRAGAAGTRARPADRARAAGSASQRLAGAGRPGARRARARRVVAGGGDAQGPVRGPGAHRGASHDAAGAVAPRRGGGAAGRRVHRVRPRHRGAAAVRARRTGGGARRATSRAAERRPGDQAPAQALVALPRHRGAAVVAAPGAAVCVDRLRNLVRSAGCGMRSGTDRLRAINVPQPVVVELDVCGSPTKIEMRSIDDRGSVTIEAVRETWRIDDEWWREPVRRMYYEVLVEGGGRVVLFVDLVTLEWFVQKP